jgi:hypothetical protein
MVGAKAETSGDDSLFSLAEAVFTSGDKWNLA